MRDPKQYQKVLKAEAPAAGFRLPEAVTATIISLTVILILCPSVYSQTALRCGDEIRIETHSGMILQGKLRHNAGTLLFLECGRAGRQRVALNDVAKACRIKRGTGTGMLLGAVAGAGAGVLAVRIISERACHEGTCCWDNFGIGLPATFIAFVGGTVAGAALGGTIGHSIVRTDEVRLDIAPMCTTSTGSLEPVGVTLGLRF
ncbi:MAG: hypothetical protein JSU65_09490 [Candidatus Zixiibacteriota bacterium]|nr:MAG: hypothetical protein JSU65_09490 [candidate division Zixibacteria bacterium]